MKTDLTDLVVQKLKWLRLPAMAEQLHPLLDKAAAENLSALELVDHLCDEEKQSRLSGARIAVRTTLTPDDLSTAAKREPSFVSWSQTTTCGTRSMVAFLACCAHHPSVGA